MARWKHILAAMTLLAVGGLQGARAQYRMDMPSTDGGQAPMPIPTITPKPGAAIPQDLEFTTSDGTKVPLSALFNHEKPVILSLVYFSCPKLCGFNQDELVRAIKAGPRELQLGKDYDVVIVSIDPDDTPAASATKRETYLKMMDRPASQPGFTYLTGNEASIKSLADTIGFGYRRQFGADDKFLHSTGIFICTPDGRESQVIGGIRFEDDQLHKSLVDASNGKLGGGMLSVALSCGAMRYNPLTGKYEANPWFYAGTAGGIVTIIFMATFLSLLWKTDVKRKISDTTHDIEPDQDTGPRTQD